MAASNVWLRDLNDQLICADQVTGMFVDRVPGLGWTVIVSTYQDGEVELADFGRGGRASTGAAHLLARLPAAIAAAAQQPEPAAYLITYTPGPAKGMGDWSTTRESGLADAAPIVEATRGRWEPDGHGDHAHGAPVDDVVRPMPRRAPAPRPAGPRPSPRRTRSSGSARDWPDPQDL